MPTHVVPQDTARFPVRCHAPRQQQRACHIRLNGSRFGPSVMAVDSHHCPELELFAFPVGCHTRAMVGGFSLESPTCAPTARHVMSCSMQSSHHHTCLRCQHIDVPSTHVRLNQPCGVSTHVVSQPTNACAMRTVCMWYCRREPSDYTVRRVQRESSGLLAMSGFAGWRDCRLWTAV